MEKPVIKERPKNTERENSDEIYRFITGLKLTEASDIATGKGGSLLVVTAPSDGDFIKYGLRLREILQEHSHELPQHKIGDIQIILVNQAGQTFEIKKEISPAPLGYVSAVYDELNKKYTNGRVTIWIVPREGQTENGLAELDSVIALKAQEVVLTTQANNQINSWPDLWSRRSSTAANIFE